MLVWYYTDLYYPHDTRGRSHLLNSLFRSKILVRCDIGRRGRNSQILKFSNDIMFGNSVIKITNPSWGDIFERFFFLNNKTILLKTVMVKQTVAAYLKSNWLLFQESSYCFSPLVHSRRWKKSDVWMVWAGIANAKSHFFNPLTAGAAYIRVFIFY